MNESYKEFASKDLLNAVKKENIPFVETLQSIILVGGKGMRLNPDRKKISQEHYPELNEKYWGQEGPKGLAMMTLDHPHKKIKKPMTDWHLEVHTSCPQVEKITLSLGTNAEMVHEYYTKRHDLKYKNVPLHFIIEKNPAGTLAPIIKLFKENNLPSTPTILANGDNLLDMDFYQAYLTGILSAKKLGIPQDELVIDLIAFVPWEHSASYGTIDLDFETNRINGFNEKTPIDQNKHITINGKEMTPINSGFSIIINPKHLFNKYLSSEVVDISTKLEEGLLVYKEHESKVKYETLYSHLASQKKMVGVFLPVYWTDLGTEEKLLSAEKEISTTAFFLNSQHI